MNPELPNPAVGGFPGALQFAGFGDNSCQCETPVKTYYGMVQPRLGFAYQLSDRLVVRGAYGIMHTRRGAVGGRAGTRNGTGILGYAALPTFQGSPDFMPAYNWTNGVPAYQKPPFFDPTLNTGFNTAHRRHRRRRDGREPRGRRHPAALPELQPRVPVRARPEGDGRASTTRAATATTWAAAAAASGRTRSIRKYLALGNLLTQNATPANIAAARARFPEIALPYANFVGTIAQMLRPVPAVRVGHRPLRRRGQLALQLGAGDARGPPLARPHLEHELHVQPPGRRHRHHPLGLQLGGREVGGRERPDRTSSTRPSSTRCRSAAATSSAAAARSRARSSRGWEISGITQFATGRPIGPVAGRLQPAAGGHLLRRLQPGLHRRRAHQRRLGRRRRPRLGPALVHRPQRVRVSRRLHVREHAAHAALRSPPARTRTTRTSASAASSRCATTCASPWASTRSTSSTT